MVAAQHAASTPTGAHQIPIGTIVTSSVKSAGSSIYDFGYHGVAGFEDVQVPWANVPGPTSYSGVAGRVVGRTVGALISITEFFGGLGISGAAGFEEAGSVGVLSPVAVPQAAAGVAVTGYGVVTIGNTFKPLDYHAISSGNGANSGRPIINTSNNPYLQGETPQAGTRSAAKDRAARLEVELVQKTGQGTLDWTPPEIDYINRNGQLPRGVVGHHINNVAEFPEWQGDPRNIKFVRGQGANLQEHGGNFHNPTMGPLIDREAIIRAAGGNQ